MGTKSGTGSTSVWQLAKERASRDAIYGDASYWDARAAAREGMARSMWPSNSFNAAWNVRQRELIARSLGNLTGRRVIDVGCGTGRISRWLAEERGASHVVGIDFSAATVEAARLEASPLVSSGLVRYERGDILGGLDSLRLGTFDDAIVLGCLSVACADRAALERAMANVAALVRKNGRVLLLEPIHRAPLLRRVLNLGVEEWVACANGAGLSLQSADRMGFVPFRLFLSVRNFPMFVVSPLFQAGERWLDRAPWLAPLSDYKLLVFERAS